MVTTPCYEPLTVQSLPLRLGSAPALRKRIGSDVSQWSVREVGDGNLNLVFVVEGQTGGAVVKQALPYVRMVGDSWPLSIKRSAFEYHALRRQESRDPGRVPEILHYDATQAIIAMEFLKPHVVLRRALIDGRQFPRVGHDLGLFLARTLFRGSDLSMDTGERKRDMALFADNVELCGISEELVFSDPYFAAKMNRHTAPQLDAEVDLLRADSDLKVEAQRLKHLFVTNAETLLHGDLHTGSVMVTDDETRVLDPEFAFYGPMAFDVGMLMANCWMSYFSQAGHEKDRSRERMREHLLTVTRQLWESFCAEFANLWRTERNGILYQRALFEDQGDMSGAEQALSQVMRSIWIDMLGFGGVEMHRRIVGLAHIADFEGIENPGLRARCETKALKFGRCLVVNRRSIRDIAAVAALAERHEMEGAR